MNKNIRWNIILIICIIFTMVISIIKKDFSSIACYFIIILSEIESITLKYELQNIEKQLRNNR